MKPVNPGIKAIVVVLTLAAGAGLYFLVDPARSDWMPKCMFYSLTGWKCPGCGSQRMLHALLHGDFARAWNENAFLLCMLPLLALMTCAAIFRRRYPKLYMRLNSLPVIIGISAALVAWWLLRNLIG